MLLGTASANNAGPAVALSFIIAGIASACAALCYAEFAGMIPVSGSAYTYGYAVLGEIFAWIIGWDILLEYTLMVAVVAIGLSGYLNESLSGFGIEIPSWAASAPGAREGAPSTCSPSCSVYSSPVCCTGGSKPAPGSTPQWSR